MTKVAIIGDTHIGARNDAPQVLEYFSKFYNEVFFPYLLNNNIKQIIHLGDLYDRRKFINFYTYDQSLEFFIGPLHKNDIQMHVILGNHCTYYKNTNELNSVELLLADCENINITKHPREIYIANRKCAFIPWICAENRENTIDLISKTDADLCFGHLELVGFETARGVVSDKGDSPSIFKNFKQVFSGHYHHKSSKGNISYLGAPYQITWDDHGVSKGFHVFDFSNDSLEFIENPLKLFHTVDANHFESKDLTKLSNGFVKLYYDSNFKKSNLSDIVSLIEKHKPIECQTVLVNKNEHTSLEEIQVDVTNISHTIQDVVDNLEITPNIRHKLQELMVDIYNVARLQDLYVKH